MGKFALHSNFHRNLADMNWHAPALLLFAIWLMIPLDFSGQITHLSWEVDTCFYPNPDPAVPFDPEGELPGNTTYRLFAHFSHPGDQLQAMYALGLGTTTTPPWTLDAPCGCFEHPFGSSIGTGTNALLLDAFPELAFDSYFTLDGNPGTSIAGGVPVIGGAPDLPFICNTVLEDAAMYVLGGVQAGSDLRIQIGQLTTCGPATLSACFQVQQVNGTLQNWCASDFPDGPLVIDPPCAPWAQANTVLTANASGSPVSVTVPFASAYPVEVELFDAETSEWVGNFSADPQFAPPPGTYFAALKDGNTCRDTTPAFCVPEPFFDCDGACLNDADGDGVCDPLEIPGCFDEVACNFEPLATDLVPCTYAEPGYDCEGECLADGDGDGVCDPFEVPGCMGIYACNFNPEATDEDGSCTYLPTFSIAGPTATVNDAPESYSYPAALNSVCTWTATGGVVSSGQGTESVEVVWSTPGLFDLVVVESNDTCSSAPVSLTIEVGANGLTQPGASALFEHAGDEWRFLVAGTLTLWDVQGRLQYQSTLAAGSLVSLPRGVLLMGQFDSGLGPTQRLTLPPR